MNPPRRSILIVSPHPDDAVFFLGGTFAKRVAEQAEIHHWCMSDGERGDLFSFLSSRREVIRETRTQELYAGINPGQVQTRSFHLPDRNVHIGVPEFKRLRDAFELIGSPAFDEIYLPEYLSEWTMFRHPDHLETGEKIRSWALEQPELRKSSILYYHSKKSDQLVELSSQERDQAIDWIKLHRSQFGWTALPPFLLDVAMILRERWLKKNSASPGTIWVETFRKENRSSSVAM